MDFSSAQSFVQSHGYVLMFFMMVIEGPVLTIAAAFAASLGIFNIWLVFLISLFADILGDVIHYWIGRLMTKKTAEETRIIPAKVKRMMSNHPFKALAVVKATPPLTSAGLVLAGALRVDFKRFFLYTVLIGIPRTMLYAAIGFFFGVAATGIIHYLKVGELWIGAFLILALLAYAVFRFTGTRRLRAKDRRNG